ncbi:interferon gamma 1-like [Menidia menidia]
MALRLHRGPRCGDLGSTVVRAVVCLALWTSVQQVSGSYVTEEMNATIQNLLEHYNMSKDDIFTGNSVVSRDPLTTDKIDISTKMVFMGGVLDTYDELVQKMLNHLPAPRPPAATPTASGAKGSEVTGDTRENLTKILKNIRNLKKFHYQEQMKLVHRLQELKEIKMDNLKVQQKLLFELPWLYDEASSLADTMRRRRKRRRRQVKAIAHRSG